MLKSSKSILLDVTLAVLAFFNAYVSEDPIWVVATVLEASSGATLDFKNPYTMVLDVLVDTSFNLAALSNGAIGFHQ